MFSGASSIIGKEVDTAFFIILGICVFMLFLITFLMVFFVIKYNRKKNPIPVNIHGNLLLEITWTVIPTMIVMFMFYIGWVGYDKEQQFPADALHVNVTARMWSWLFEYENGKKGSELKLPLGKTVVLELHAEDVLHSFYVPAFRIKKDMVPGMKTRIMVTPDEIGTYDILCAEFCGVGHSAMLSKVEVMPEKEFAGWLQGDEAEKEMNGMGLLQAKGCKGCHALDGSRLVGPSFKGLFGQKHLVVTEGKEREIVADEDYLRRSMLEPNADVVKDYPAIMPSQQGKLTSEEIEKIIEALKNLSE
jgi:cytochrome c oxidase subunit 2